MFSVKASKAAFPLLIFILSDTTLTFLSPVILSFSLCFLVPLLFRTISVSLFLYFSPLCPFLCFILDYCPCFSLSFPLLFPFIKPYFSLLDLRLLVPLYCFHGWYCFLLSGEPQIFLRWWWPSKHLISWALITSSCHLSESKARIGSELRSRGVIGSVDWSEALIGWEVCEIALVGSAELHLGLLLEF